MMNSNILSKIIIFTAGAAVGSVVTWALVKDKYERIAQEDIESVREMYAKRDSGKTEDGENDDESNEPKDQAAKDIYEQIVRNADYSNSEEEEEDDMEKPYVISPEEYDENGYKTRSLTYYADGVLVDEHDKVIRRVEKLIGVDSLNHFGEYEDDSVFVRNDAAKTDFEILKDYRNYSEIK